MRTGKPILSKRTRRAIYGGLLALALGAPIAMIVLTLYRAPFERHYFMLFQVASVSMSMLLFWCVAYVTTEPLLVQVVLIILGLLFALAYGARLPQF